MGRLVRRLKPYVLLQMLGKNFKPKMSFVFDVVEFLLVNSSL